MNRRSCSFVTIVAIFLGSLFIGYHHSSALADAAVGNSLLPCSEMDGEDDPDCSTTMLDLLNSRSFAHVDLHAIRRKLKRTRVVDDGGNSKLKSLIQKLEEKGITGGDKIDTKTTIEGLDTAIASLNEVITKLESDPSSPALLIDLYKDSQKNLLSARQYGIGLLYIPGFVGVWLTYLLAAIGTIWVGETIFPEITQAVDPIKDVAIYLLYLWYQWRVG